MLISQEPVPPTGEILQLDPRRIAPNPDQPRKRFPASELEMLKASIAREGCLQPLLVRQDGDSFQLVAGERRLRAAQELELKTVPAVLLPVGEDRLLELALVENVQREDLNPIELAQGYRQLMDVKGWTQENLAEALGVSRSGVSNTLRLLELPEDIQDSIARGQITMGHAKVLLSVSEPREQRLLFERIAEEKLTVRDLEEEREAKMPPGGDQSPRRRKKPRDGVTTPPHIQNLEEQFSEALGTRVRIRERRGRGKLVIEFYSAEDFERIRNVLFAAASEAR
jgi:ParB family chromosome partitioning protein